MTTNDVQKSEESVPQHMAYDIFGHILGAGRPQIRLFDSEFQSPVHNKLALCPLCVCFFSIWKTMSNNADTLYSEASYLKVW